MNGLTNQKTKNGQRENGKIAKKNERSTGKSERTAVRKNEEFKCL
jgi:hypothetical protein